MISEPLFLNALSSALFLHHIPDQYSKWIEDVAVPPSTYRSKYSKRVPDSELVRYTEDNLSRINIEGFISADLIFLSQIQKDYQSLKESKEEEEIDDTLDNSDKNQREAIDLVLKRLTSEEINKIKFSHFSLSIALGIPVGIWELETNFTHLSPTNYSEAILDSIYNGTYKDYMAQEEFISNKFSKTLINFLRSKDDSLLLLIGSLLYSFTLSKTVDPALLYESNLYPIGNRKKSLILNSLIANKDSTEERKQSKLNFEEEKSLVSGSTRDRIEFERNILETTTTRIYNDKVMNMLLDLLLVDPSFRPVTFKFLSVITLNLCYNKRLSECLSSKQYDVLIEAYHLSIKNVKRMYSKPQLNTSFIEIFEQEWNEFVFADHKHLNTVISSPW